MFSMLRMLLRTTYPIERPSSELGRKAGIYHLPWIRIGLKQQSFLSDAGLLLYLMAMACVTPQTRGSVDYPSTHGILMKVG